MEVIIFIIISYGVTTIVTESDLFYDLIEKTSGKLYELLRCPLCLSTWVGFIMGLIFSPIAIYVELPYVLDIFACGMLSAGGVHLINQLK